jgi:nucleotidyltransferase substrate binding protein (TIGR01987 family)
MEIFKLKLKDYKKALKTLSEIISEKENDIIRDATIQRFEYTFELAWKTLKQFLKESHGIIANSPKAVFREGFKIGLFDEKVTQLFLEMTDDRNETVHLYDENRINNIFANIKTKYYKILHELARKLS